MIAAWQGMLPITGDVVIVEDDPILRPLMGDILKDLRIESLAFETADDALMHALNQHGRCGLLIADHSVPGQIQGTELATMFRSKWPEIPIIVTSGYELETATLPDGVAYLQKPWSVDTLISTIAAVVQPGVPVSRIHSCPVGDSPITSPSS